MAIFDTTQVPLQEPMYINGQLSQVWHMFFLRLSRVAAVDDGVDLTNITQLAHQAPTQATQGQMLIDMGVLKESPPLMQQQAHQKEIPQPLQAVFLHPDQYAPLANINITNSHPNSFVSVNIPAEQDTQPVAIPPSEIIHDSI